MTANATPSFWTNFVTAIDAEAAKVEQEAVSLYKTVEPVVVQYSEAFISALAQIAIGAVLKQLPLVISGAEKFGTAVTDVVQTVEANGQPIAVQDAQAAVQVAFTKIQSIVTPKS